FEFVDEAKGERNLGADDGEGRLLDGNEVHHLLEVVDVDGEALCKCGDATIAGRGDDLCNLFGFAQSPDEGVLAPSATDDQNLHVSYSPSPCFFRKIFIPKA